jgi:hypothetical protein
MSFLPRLKLQICLSRTSLLATVLVLLFSHDAFAGKIKLTGHTDYRDGVGGEFNIQAYDLGGYTLLDGALSDGYTTVNGTTPGTANGTAMNVGFGGLVGFQTFCIEYSEHISLGGIYEAAISGGSIYGGVAGGVDPDGGGPLPKTDPISIGTAYLYTMFATGSLTGYNYTNGGGRADSAEMLQHAFWYLEDEISLTQAQKNSNIFLTGAIGAITLFGDGTGVGVGGAKANNNSGVYHVGALNLWNSSNGAQQDQLIMLDPPDVKKVPDGGTTLLLLSLALGALGPLRRRGH